MGAQDSTSLSDNQRSALRSGAVTALLKELAAVPEPTVEAWRGLLRPGARIGRFELVRQLGAGGFATVWEAIDRDLGRSVAFKAVRRGPAVLREQFVREAEAAAGLSHPNIVTLFDAGRAEQGPYLVLELLRGETLAHRLERGPLPAREALRIALDVANGLAHAHGKGIVHRDVTPSNVFLCTDGGVKVLDFGLARAFGRAGSGGGTRGYMAPEQAAGGPEDERADVYSLGVIIREMVTGDREVGATPAGGAGGGRMRAALLALARQMTAADPARRPRDGGATLAALVALEHRAVRNTASRRRWVAAAVAFVLASSAYLVWERLGAARGGGGAPGAGARQPGASNLDAYRHYFEALRYDDQYEWDRMQAELLAALHDDPSFALAHLRLATTALYYAAPIAGVDPPSHLRAASEHGERLPVHEQHVVRAELAWLAGQADEADHLYEAALRARGDDKRALLRLAWMRSKRNDLAAGLPLAERALAVDPSWTPAQDYVAIALVFRGDFDRALGLARGWAERWPNPLSYGILNGVLLHAGDPAAALPVARRAAELWGRADLGMVGRTLLMLDRFDEAEREAREAWRHGVRYRDASLPIVLRYRGKTTAAQGVAEELARSGQEGFARQLRAVLAAGAGDRATLRALANAGAAVPNPLWFAGSLALGGEADAAARVLDAAGIDAVGTSGGRLILFRGLVAAARLRDRGDLTSARRTLEELRRRLELPYAHVAAYPLGEICHRLRDDRCALEALGEFRRNHWLSDDSAWAYPRSLYLSALSEERLGMRERARATAGRLLAIWSEADAGTPLLEETRALARRLGTQ